MQCSNGDCIDMDYVCDGLQDCPNGEDEINCAGQVELTACTSSWSCVVINFVADSCDFKCGDGHCIANSHVCDSLLDCADHSDADNCTRGLTAVQYLMASDIPLQCPNASNQLAACGHTCSVGEEDCRAGQLCCDTGCGHTCVAGVPIHPICRTMAQRSQEAGLIGAFQPSCEEDGRFSELQCHGSTGFCWCVDVETGQPVTNGTRGGEACTRCTTANGDSVPVGTSFSSRDGCNTWYVNYLEGSKL